VPGILPPNEQANVCDMGCIREEADSSLNTSFVVQGDCCNLLVFSFLLFFQVRRSFLPRRNYWMTRKSLCKGFCCIFIVVLGA
jgi:hypothetical protein